MLALIRDFYESTRLNNIRFFRIGLPAESFAEPFKESFKEPGEPHCLIS
jgi:hypothetical protein